MILPHKASLSYNLYFFDYGITLDLVKLDHAVLNVL